MKDVAALFLQRVQSGLARASLSKCSGWAEMYRVMPSGPWRFDRYPWLREMMDSEATHCVGQKSAQMGYTECVLNKTFHTIDIKGLDCLYVLPARTPDASDFSASRFDAALELSPHLSKLFSDVKNVGHKRAGSANLYVRGSRSRAGLKSIPASFIVFDEMDEMDQENIPLALERASGQLLKQIWQISTPTVEDVGINVPFKKSTMEHFMFRCPSCSKLIDLTFPESVVICEDKPKESHLKCKYCQAKLTHETKVDWLKDGKWVPTRTDTDVRGFYVNQLYSTTVTPEELTASVLRAAYSAADEQELYNSKLGLPHSPKGSIITEDQVIACKGGHTQLERAPNYGIVCMGVDVGKLLHVEISAYIYPQVYNSSLDMNTQCDCKVIKICTVKEFEELDYLMKQFGVQMCVIDIHPERRKAYEFACRNYGRVFMCYYPEGLAGKQLSKNDNELSVGVDRTSWLDSSLGRFQLKTIQLPLDTPIDYIIQVRSQRRILKKDVNGNPIARYVTGDGVADHYGHARNYCEIALPLATENAQARSVQL